jgi:hypothetical protein
MVQGSDRSYWLTVIIHFQIKSHHAYHHFPVESSSVLRRGLEWDRRHHTRSGLSASPAEVPSIRTLSTFTLEERAGADLRVRLAGLAIMPERSFNIRFFILFLGDLVDGGFDVIEVLRVLESERVILNKVRIQQQTRSAINI